VKKRFLVGGLATAATLALAFGAYAGIAKVSRTAAATPLPRSSCGALQFKGSGSPQFIIASDLPLQGSSRSQTIELSKAIGFEFGEAGFKAGKYTFGYQSCDDSTAQAGKWDPAKCSANAQNYVRNAAVIGVIGTFNSGCAAIEIATSNRAGLGYVSPANTYVGLTHSAPGVTAPGEPNKYYPSGKRTYIRVVAADDYQGTADALLAKSLNVGKTYILNDKESYGAGVAGTYRNGSKAVGLTVVGDEAWDPKASSYADLATKIKNAGANSVFLGGLECENGGKLIKDLRAGLGAGVTIIAPDGFSSFKDTIAHAGSASEGMYISIAGQPFKFLGPGGKSFATKFGKSLGLAPDKVNPYSNYGATAALVMLKAIAASNGTRASVTANLFKTKLSDSPIGGFSINHNGDTNLGPVSIYKVSGSNANFFKVIKPPASLVAKA
jgi:branched-chain amino acid transport system substrate-binding protein